MVDYNRLWDEYDRLCALHKVHEDLEERFNLPHEELRSTKWRRFRAEIRFLLDLREIAEGELESTDGAANENSIPDRALIDARFPDFSGNHDAVLDRSTPPLLSAMQSDVTTTMATSCSAAMKKMILKNEVLAEWKSTKILCLKQQQSIENSSGNRLLITLNLSNSANDDDLVEIGSPESIEPYVVSLVNDAGFYVEKHHLISEYHTTLKFGQVRMFGKSWTECISGFEGGGNLVKLWIDNVLEMSAYNFDGTFEIVFVLGVGSWLVSGGNDLLLVTMHIHVVNSPSKSEKVPRNDSFCYVAGSPDSLLARKRGKCLKKEVFVGLKSDGILTRAPRARNTEHAMELDYFPCTCSSKWLACCVGKLEQIQTGPKTPQPWEEIVTCFKCGTATTWIFSKAMIVSPPVQQARYGYSRSIFPFSQHISCELPLKSESKKDPLAILRNELVPNPSR